MFSIASLATTIVLSASAFLGVNAPITEAPPTSESVTECLSHMPCFDAHLEEQWEEISEEDEGETFSVIEEDAWDSIGELHLPPLTSQSDSTDEYVGSFSGSVPEFDETHFKVPSLQFPNTWHVFKVVTLSKA